MRWSSSCVLSIWVNFPNKLPLDIVVVLYSDRALFGEPLWPSELLIAETAIQDE